MTFRKESSIIIPEITKEEEEVLEKVTDQSDVVDAKVTSEKVILVSMNNPPLTRFILLHISSFIG